MKLQDHFLFHDFSYGNSTPVFTNRPQIVCKHVLTCLNPVVTASTISFWVDARWDDPSSKTFPFSKLWHWEGGFLHVWMKPLLQILTFPARIIQLLISTHYSTIFNLPWGLFEMTNCLWWPRWYTLKCFCIAPRYLSLRCRGPSRTLHNLAK